MHTTNATGTMKVYHRADMFGGYFTVCLYKIDGEPASARLQGHLTPRQAEERIEDYRATERKWRGEGP